MPTSAMRAPLFAALSLACLAAGSCQALRCGSSGSSSSGAETPGSDPGSFADNPIVYFVMTDRFVNGNPANDRSYGRKPDGEKEIATFHGGDLAGLTSKVEDGYFDELGVNAIWLTAPYEQIHGWVVGGKEEFRHYAYHGYYALDYTVLDHNMGTEGDLEALVSAAHARGIRIVFDIVMNHPGYADLQTLHDVGIEVLWPGWEKATLRDYHSYIDYNDFDFKNWWGPDWVRSDLAGYRPGDSDDDRTKQLAYLPDFKTESRTPVALPEFLRTKPDTRAREVEGYTVRDYLVAWLSDWVRRFGIDGFRCDTVKHVDYESWAALERAGVSALREWKSKHPGGAIDDGEFWMTGEVFPHGVERSAYFDHGFDNLINFDFQKRLAALQEDEAGLAMLDAIYAEYAGKLAGKAGFNVLSYLSSHDTELFARDRSIAGGTALLLAPGGVQIFYGDETARPPGPAPSSDPQQATRSAMNWDSIDERVLAHWQALGQFRRRHVALAKGRHVELARRPYTFGRIHERDRVVAAIFTPGQRREAAGKVTAIAVGGVFADGTRVREAFTKTTVVVAAGAASVPVADTGVVLLEGANP